MSAVTMIFSDPVKIAFKPNLAYYQLLDSTLCYLATPWLRPSNLLAIKTAKLGQRGANAILRNSSLTERQLLCVRLANSSSAAGQTMATIALKGTGATKLAGYIALQAAKKTGQRVLVVVQDERETDGLVQFLSDKGKSAVARFVCGWSRWQYHAKVLCLPGKGASQLA
jgi:hypothetical protein